MTVHVFSSVRFMLVTVWASNDSFKVYRKQDEVNKCTLQSNKREVGVEGFDVKFII
jgi:heme-degrading monooxygenase HmoA